MSHNNVFRTAGNISAARQNYSAGLRAAEPIELASDDNDEIQRKILEMEEMLPDEEIPDSPLSSSHRKHSKQVEYVNTNANDEYSSDEEGSIVFFEQGFPNQIQHSSASTLLMTMSDIEIQSSASLDPNTLEAIDFEEYKNMVSKREALREAPVSPTPEIEESKNSPLKITIKKQSPNGKPLFIDVKQPSRSASIEDLPNSVSREQRGSADSIISPPIVSPREETFNSLDHMYSTLSNVATAQSGIVNKSMVVEFIKAIWGVKSLLYRRAAIRMLRNSDRSVLSEATKSSRALDLIQSWIISCISDQDAGVENAGAFLVEVIKLLSQLEITLDILRNTKLGRVVKKLTKNSDRRIQMLAQSLQQQWAQLITSPTLSTHSASNDIPPAVSEKRIAEQNVESAAVKKLKPTVTTTTRPPVKPAEKKPAPSVAIPSKPRGIDMSAMFGTSSESVKIKKKTVPTSRPAVPFSLDDILKSTVPSPRKAIHITKPSPAPLSRSSSQNSVNDNDSSTGSVNSKQQGIKLDSKGRPKKSVSWAPDTKLRAVKVFISDEIDREARRSIFKSNLMDKGEGQAMKAHVSIDEESQTGPSIPWKTPQLIEIPPDAKVEVNSEAAKIQSDREKTVLQAVYYDTVYIPPSPAEADPEPDSQVSPKQIPLQDLSISHEEPSQPHQQPFLGIDPGMISGLLNVNSQTPPLYQQAYLPPQQHQPYMPQPQFPAYTNVAQGGGFIQQQQMLQTNAPANATQPFIQSKSQQQQYIHKR